MPKVYTLWENTSAAKTVKQQLKSGCLLLLKKGIFGDASCTRLKKLRHVCRNKASWHVKASAIQQSPCQSCDLPSLPSSSWRSSSSRVLVTHMANYRWKLRRWCELKACSHMVGVQTTRGIHSGKLCKRGKTKLISWSSLLSSPLIHRSVVYQSLLFSQSILPLTFLYYSTARKRVSGRVQ